MMFHDVDNVLHDVAVAPLYPSPSPFIAPWFSHLFDTVLGSPFLTMSDVPDLELVDGAPLIIPHVHTIARSSSSTPTVDPSTFLFVRFDFNVSTPKSLSIQEYFTPHLGRSFNP
ncbi:hypothetical protein H2248_001033 [Termitomyces sp. 'cryptogamus']|nr:hypothetical protein H2248_001033 [Termitomyces sp. 'cryptogamus']